MVIVDTTVWIDYFRGAENSETRWLEARLQLQPLGLTDLILCEILQGIKNDHDFSRVQSDLMKFHVFHMGGSALAIATAKNHRILRGHGYTVHKTIDCLIATFCLQEEHELLHRDRDFDPFEKVLGLKVTHAI